MARLEHYRNNGFTLVEVLIALFVYTVVITIVSVALTNMLNTSNTSIKEIIYFNKLQRIMLMLQRDLIQTSKRPILDADNNLQPAFIFPSPEESFLLSFSSHIGNNLFPQEHTSDIRRIGYRYRNNALYRIVWPVLDRVNNHYQERKMLGNIKKLSWQFIDNNHVRYTKWPPASSRNNEQLPVAVKLTLILNNGDKIEKLFLL